MTRRVYRSTDYGAPNIQGQAQKLIDFLQAVLVDGYGTQTLSAGALTASGTTCTLVTPIAHGWVGTAKITVAGATPSAYNGEFSATVTGANTVTYTALSAPGTSPATGTITVKLAGAGWTKPAGMVGTNVAAFKQGVGSSGFYLNVDDTNTTYSIVRGYEDMTAVNTGTGLFPTTTQSATGLYMVKSSTADTTNRPWVCVATEEFFALYIDTNSSGTGVQSNIHFFGDIASYIPGDSTRAMLKANTGTTYSATTYTPNTSITSAFNGAYLSRPYSQLTGATTVSIITDYSKGGAGNFGNGGMPYPNPADNGVYLSKVWIGEPATGTLRGEIPGVLNPLHAAPFQHLETFNGIGDFAGRTFQAVKFYSSSQLCLEISDT